MKILKVIHIRPLPAPRMVASDRFLVNKDILKIKNPLKRKRKQMLDRWWAYKDELRLKLGNFKLPDKNIHIFFLFSIPKSWTKKKRKAVLEQPYAAHQQTPDADNLFKAFSDILFKRGEHIFDVRITKLWHTKDMIVIAESEDIGEVIKKLEKS